MKKLAITARFALLAVAGITLIGFALRLARYHQSVYGDEISTLYIIRGRSLSDVVHMVASDAEISPPLYFILAWITAKLGSAPELMRLPSLIAGTVSIPLVYLVGARALNRLTGVIAAAIMALSPFMIFYSADGRGYAVAIALLLGTTLTMLAGARTSRMRWWIAYAVLTALAMYTHYTAAFVLVAQLAWLMWAHRECRRPALLANAGAVVLYLPWIPNLIADMNSPTIDILGVIVGSGIGTKLEAVVAWIAGQPYVETSAFPGVPVFAVLLAGFLVASAATLWQHAKARDLRESISNNPGLVLFAALALATPILELLLLMLGGTDLFGARNLNSSSAGLALLIGAVLASSSLVVGTICTVAVVGAFGIGAARTLEDTGRLSDSSGAADVIASQIAPGDVIVDMASAAWTPVPLTGLDAYLDTDNTEIRPFLPTGEPPFLPFKNDPPPADELISQAFSAANGHRVFLLGLDDRMIVEEGELTAIITDPRVPSTPGAEVTPLPSGWKVVEADRFPGVNPLNLFVIESPTADSGG